MVGIDRYRSALWLRLVTATGSAVALIGAFISLFGGCLASPYAQLDPLVVSLWLDKVQETISLAAMLRLGPVGSPQLLCVSFNYLGDSRGGADPIESAR